MFKQFLQAYRTYGMIKTVEKEIHKMFKLANKLYKASSKALLEQRKVDFDLYAQDREINELVVDVRKKIVEHLSVSACHNVGGELVFLKVINDIERVGDYSKNIMDLAKMLATPLSKSIYLKSFKEMRSQVKKFFPKAEKALFDGVEQDANDVIDGHHQINQDCEELLEKLMNDDTLKGPEAVALALTTRYFKRISSHLKNVASTAVNPYHHIGYMHPADAQPKEKVPHF